MVKTLSSKLRYSYPLLIAFLTLSISENVFNIDKYDKLLITTCFFAIVCIFFKRFIVKSYRRLSIDNENILLCCLATMLVVSAYYFGIENGIIITVTKLLMFICSEILLRALIYKIFSNTSQGALVSGLCNAIVYSKFLGYLLSYSYIINGIVDFLLYTFLGVVLYRLYVKKQNIFIVVIYQIVISILSTLLLLTI